MTEAQARKEARKESETYGAHFVVYIFDEGYSVYDRDQIRRYHSVVMIEACYMEGREVPRSVWSHLVPKAA